MLDISIRDLEPQLSVNRRYWASWAGADPDAELGIYRTGIPHRLLNGVLRLRGRAVSEAAAEAKQKLAGTSWSWWVGEDSEPGTAEQLVGLGAKETGSAPIMAMDISGLLASVNRPVGLTVQRVTGEPAMREFVRTYSGPLGFRKDAFEDIVERELEFAARDRNVVRLVGLYNGRVAGTAAVTLGDDVAGLYYIATDSHRRRRGVATALTVAALRIAQASGAGIATLQSSDAGVPVYRAIGFEEVGRYHFYDFRE